LFSANGWRKYMHGMTEHLCRPGEVGSIGSYASGIWREFTRKYRNSHV
jgi:hypothetical protein